MSECLTCAFRESCCSARLSRAQVPAFVGSCPGEDSSPLVSCLLYWPVGVQSKFFAEKSVLERIAVPF